MMPPRRNDAGLSLVELLVAMLLLGVFMTMISSLYLSASRSLGQAKLLTANTRQVSNGMNEVARVIRAATENPVSGYPLPDPALLEATPEAVTLYAYVNLGMPTQQPVKIRLSLDADRRLVETRWAATALSGGYFGFSGEPESSRIIAETVAPGDPGTFLFGYRDAAGLPLLGSGGDGTLLTNTELRSVASVSVNLTVQATVTDARSAVTLHNTVGMPNVAVAAGAS
ncbi:type II secretion system protein [Cryobacterium sp. TMS1-20-1]|uniref:PulJ/GspJ family protein n=1 Tax=Cryobacterium sp. TMS1-20-1 TaxID=1259223 RepID=UPI00106CE74E|nr:prepilin-type N-terminal cleavage/methylation domain-containing protein [Cryobacterium sp. TMS1-20-1]TFC81525.1 type II secretion system protein [Cryobacterium sp. TMS1-20-1]